MEKFLDIIEQLSSPDEKVVIKAIEKLVASEGGDALPPLLDFMEKTDSHRIRNAIALALRDIGDQRALIPIMNLIKSDRTAGQKGTLVYALQTLDCRPILLSLIDLVIESSFEVSHEAFLVIESIDSKIDTETWDLCLSKMDSARSKKDCINLELVEQLRELFLGE